MEAIMKVIEENYIVYFDIDETLIFNVGVKYSHPEKIKIDCEGMRNYAIPHTTHIEALKKHKENGYTVIVWSHGRWRWAEAVVKALKLQQYVDFVMSKPDFMYDDAPLDDNFMRVWKKDKNEPKK
jgi:hydroxymethylpyrimidine pyrophosphatase-like HAD family hydrolase